MARPERSGAMPSLEVAVAVDRAAVTHPPLVAVGTDRAHRQCTVAWVRTGGLAVLLATAAAAVAVAGLQSLAVACVSAAALLVVRGLRHIGLPSQRIRRVARAVADGSASVPARVTQRLGPYASLQLGSGRHVVVWCAGQVLPPAGTRVGFVELPSCAVVVVGPSAWLVTGPVRHDVVASGLARLASRRAG